MIIAYIIIQSYFELGLLYKKFKINTWFLMILAILPFLGLFLIDGIVSLEITLGPIPLSQIVSPAFWLKPNILLISGGMIALPPGIQLYLRLGKPMPKIKKVELEEKYIGGVYLFMTEVCNLLGGSGQTIFESAVKGYNERFDKDIKIDDTIHLSGLTDEEWPKFIEFLLSIFYQCVGPITFECCKKIREMPEIKEIVERAEEKFRK
jgi:hypothetical protein